MDKEKSALLAVWLSFAVSLATLVITAAALVIGGIALLSIDQVRWVACQNLGYECGFARAGAYLLTLDADPAPVPPKQTGLDMPPPDLPDLGLPAPNNHVTPPTAWDLLAVSVYPPTEEDILNGTVVGADTQCLSLKSLQPYLARADKIYSLVDNNWRWKVNFLTAPVDEGVVPSGADVNPRSILFEMDATYAPLQREVDLHLQVNAYQHSVFGVQIIPAMSRDYTIQLPAGSSGIEYLCPLPDMVPAQYSLFINTSSAIGDWQRDIGPLDLNIRSVNEP